ncbi:hypothetical protein [Nocardioides jiangxiensis]|uniref:DUF559 domain-containing protein n=1 Tax=Nocardioides jiangxiensis TaxID=3064524 RepID=A0ABT9AYK6_9ACTN|nr:hypothetical protein [Nocardioides sp. WY-20]MDO7867666.1 hypothetical protein [Nocardioides sp. WY-20]
MREQEGILIERRDDWVALVQANLSPPRVRVEHAAIDAAAGAASDLSAMGILSEVVRSRRTTPQRLLAVTEDRTRLRRRELIVGVLSDAASGAASVLEIEFLRNVERAHGLPRALRQVRDVTSGLSLSSEVARVVYRDAALPAFRLLIELDGRLGHSTSADRDTDFERDLDAAVGEQTTVRLGWGQAVVRPCVTAIKLARLYRSRGWQGPFRCCPRCPEGLRLRGDSAA